MRDKFTCKCRSLSVVNKVIVNLTTRITNDNYIHCKMTVDTSRFLFELLIGRSSSNSKALGTTNCTNGNIRWMELNTLSVSFLPSLCLSCSFSPSSSLPPLFPLLLYISFPPSLCLIFLLVCLLAAIYRKF